MGEESTRFYIDENPDFLQYLESTAPILSPLLRHIQDITTMFEAMATNPALFSKDRLVNLYLAEAARVREGMATFRARTPPASAAEYYAFMVQGFNHFDVALDTVEHCIDSHDLGDIDMAALEMGLGANDTAAAADLLRNMQS